MLRLYKTLLRHVLHKKPVVVDINNVLNLQFLDTFALVHHFWPYRTNSLLPALYNLECIADNNVPRVSVFTMPKMKRKSKHKKSKHSRRHHKKAKYSVPEIIEISSSSSESESDIAVVFDLKQERLRIANENIVNVPDSDTEDIKCEKITDIEVNLVHESENISNENVIKKEKMKPVADMENTASEKIAWNNVQNRASASDKCESIEMVPHESIASVPVSYAYGLTYGYSSFYPGNLYLSSNVQTGSLAYAEAAAKCYSSALCETQSAGYVVNNIWDIVERERNKLKGKRQWEQTHFGASLASKLKSSLGQLVFTIMSYNVLAQDLIHQHQYLYQTHDQRALSWEVRSQILLNEIKEANAQILCLQEVQQSHLDTFYKQLIDLGYDGIYKKRTGNNVDGVAIYYKTDTFELIDYTTIEYFQPNINRLNRDNVGLVAKLACKMNPNKHLVVATTHLLFNPRRHDVKLSQIQVLLAEVERFAFDSYRFGKSHYWPVIITGDMNFLPYSGVYRLLTEGSFHYEGRCSRTLRKEAHLGNVLDKTLLPDSLEITDTCQHWGILCKRRVKKMDHKAEIRHLKIYNSDHLRLLKSFERKGETVKQDVDEAASISAFPESGFGTGKLSHPFHFHSVYKHGTRDGQKREVTTNQENWVTVDYIFYSVGWNEKKKKKTEDELQLVARYKLLTAAEAEMFGAIPNFASPSDHYPLLATFVLRT